MPSNTFKQTAPPRRKQSKGRRGAPIGNQNARKHGHRARKLKLNDVQLVDISRQNGPGQMVAEKADRIFEDAGGRDALTELKKDQVNRYLITELLIQSLDCWLLEQGSLVNKRKRAVYPILLERTRLAETSLKLATAIGLERRQKPLKTLQDYLSEKTQVSAVHPASGDPK